jgi:hypothetical protein
MVGSMYFFSVTELFLAQPPMYLMTGRGAPMQLAAEAVPFRRLCDVHLKPAGALFLLCGARWLAKWKALRRLPTRRRLQQVRSSKRRQGGSLVVGRAEGLSLPGVVVQEVG